MNRAALQSGAPFHAWILLDADGTVFDFDAAQAAALAATLAAAGLPADGRLLAPYQRIGSELWGLYEAGAISSLELRERRFARLLGEAGLDGDPAALSRDYLRRLSRRGELLPGALGAMHALRAAGCRLWLATNGLAEVQRPRFAASPVTPLTEGALISEELGVAKPQAGFFDAAFVAMGQPPRERVLMVGDSWSADIAGGLNYGLDTAWIRPAGDEPRPGPQPRWTLDALSELPEKVLALQV
jgi:2-haloacid dehalogenase